MRAVDCIDCWHGRNARIPSIQKYWGKYTDMGSVFLDNVQGLETLKTFDVDARAAKKMNEQAEQFRVMTMNVLQIQLRSLAAMDIVAYGGAAAGVGVAIWQYANGAALPLAGVLLIVLLSADFFIPLRQLGSFFHVAMNGMTSTKRISHCLIRRFLRMGCRKCRNSVLPITVWTCALMTCRSDMRTWARMLRRL